MPCCLHRAACTVLSVRAHVIFASALLSSLIFKYMQALFTTARSTCAHGDSQYQGNNIIEALLSFSPIFSLTSSFSRCGLLSTRVCLLVSLVGNAWQISVSWPLSWPFLFVFSLGELDIPAPHNNPTPCRPHTFDASSHIISYPWLMHDEDSDAALPWA